MFDYEPTAGCQIATSLSPRESPLHDPGLLAVRRGTAYRTVRYALSPVMGECCSEHEILCKTRFVSKLWQARLLALIEAGYKLPAGHQPYFVGCCPSVGVLHRVDYRPPHPCHLRDLCPWCWAREHVVGLYRDLEGTFYDSPRSRKPKGLHIMTTRTWMRMPCEAITLCELFDRLSAARKLYHKAVHRQLVFGGHWRITVEALDNASAKARNSRTGSSPAAPARSVSWAVCHRLLTICRPEQREWKPSFDFGLPGSCFAKTERCRKITRQQLARLTGSVLRYPQGLLQTGPLPETVALLNFRIGRRFYAAERYGMLRAARRFDEEMREEEGRQRRSEAEITNTRGDDAHDSLGKFTSACYNETA